MKLLSVAIPSYNSQDYMSNCIESLLPAGEEIEIIIVNDGSKDNTAAIAEEYAAKYPTIVRAVHQENGGHGEAVNAGLRNATGAFFKVVDSDDWVDAESLPKVMDTLRKFVTDKEKIDMMISNFMYDKVDADNKKIMQYRKYMPTGKVFGWDDVKKMPSGTYILMHSVIYRTGLLRKCQLELPKHTFYVDNIFVFNPLPYVKKMYYLDELVYHYYIGREDQSVNEKVMIGRIDQQIRVNKIMIDTLANTQVANRKCRDYMRSYLDIITTVSTMLAFVSGTEENLQKKEELWDYLKAADTKLYKSIRYGLLGMCCNLPGKTGRKIFIFGYHIAQKLVGFN